MEQFLIVDSDRDVSNMLQEALQEAFGAEVTQARKGALAIEALRERKFDLALIETMLPDMSGFELAERAANCQVPALLMTGHPAGQAACKAYGYPHLEKPFSLQELADVAGTLIGNSQRNITRMHWSYGKLIASLNRTEAIALGIRQTIIDEANRVISASRQRRRLIAESASHGSSLTGRGRRIVSG